MFHAIRGEYGEVDLDVKEGIESGEINSIEIRSVCFEAVWKFNYYFQWWSRRKSVATVIFHKISYR